MTIKTVNNVEDAIVDIVLVPGLDVPGQPQWTFTKENSDSVFWPESLLAPRIPNARILTFNHVNMTIDTFWNERDQISTKSNRLIKDLLDVRGGTNDDRPIIFVAHCLGGLVVQEALMRASRKQHECKIADKTVGLILLGTPNYNDDSLLKEAKKYFMLANIDPPSDSKLKAQSTRILEIPRAFKAFMEARTLRVDIFYAESPISINGEDVYLVEASVAKIEGMGDPDSMSGNHHEIARFDCANESFADLFRPIRDLAADIIKKQQKGQGETTNISFAGENRGLQVGQNKGSVSGNTFNEAPSRPR